MKHKTIIKTVTFFVAGFVLSQQVLLGAPTCVDETRMAYKDPAYLKHLLELASKFDTEVSTARLAMLNIAAGAVDKMSLMMKGLPAGVREFLYNKRGKFGLSDNKTDEGYKTKYKDITKDNRSAAVAGLQAESFLGLTVKADMDTVIEAFFEHLLMISASFSNHYKKTLSIFSYQKFMKLLEKGREDGFSQAVRENIISLNIKSGNALGNLENIDKQVGELVVNSALNTNISDEVLMSSVAEKIHRGDFMSLQDFEANDKKLFDWYSLNYNSQNITLAMDAAYSASNGDFSSKAYLNKKDGVSDIMIILRSHP